MCNEQRSCDMIKSSKTAINPPHSEHHFESFSWRQTLWPPITTAFSVRTNTTYLFKAMLNSCSSTLRCQQTSAKSLSDWMSARTCAMMNFSGRNVCVCHRFTPIREHENNTTWWHLSDSTLGLKVCVCLCVWISMSQAEKEWGEADRQKLRERSRVIRTDNDRLTLIHYLHPVLLVCSLVWEFARCLKDLVGSQRTSDLSLVG